MASVKSLHMADVEDDSGAASSDPDWDDDCDPSSSGAAGELDESGSDDGADLGLVEEAGPSKRGAECVGYRIIKSSELRRVQQRAIADVVSIWGCRPALAKTMLMAYMWDRYAVPGDRGGLCASTV